MKFEDDDLKDGKLWAALQKEIDRDLAEKESGETFQEELADIEDSIEFESKETKSEDHIPDEKNRIQKSPKPTGKCENKNRRAFPVSGTACHAEKNSL